MKLYQSKNNMSSLVIKPQKYKEKRGITIVEAGKHMNEWEYLT